MFWSMDIRHAHMLLRIIESCYRFLEYDVCWCFKDRTYFSYKLDITIQTAKTSKFKGGLDDRDFNMKFHEIIKKYK